MATEEIKNQEEEVLEETEQQEELVEAPEHEEEQSEEVLAEKSKAKVKEDDDEDEDEEESDDDDEEEEEEEQVKKEDVKVPTTKAAMIKALFDKVNGMKKEEVSSRWKELMSVAEAEDLGGPTPTDSDPEKDEVGKKKKKVKISKVDGYLNYVVEEWMRENELALEGSLRSEITEEFIGGLKNLFTEHYIEVPDEKVDIVEGLYDKVEELEEKLNSQIEENVKTKDELNEYRKNKILEEVCEDLADTQSEKMKSLVEGVSYEDDADDFENKVKTIKENYFPNQTKQDENVEQEDVTTENGEESPKMSNIMEAYSKAIARS